MDITRRDFLKISGAASAGLFLGSVFDLKPIKAYADIPPEWETLTYSVCCYCAVGCGLLVGVKDDEHVTYVQGHPDHPINRGSLCSKGQAIAQLRTVDGALNPRRKLKPLYRGDGDMAWTEVSWDWALDKLVEKIRNTRDTNTWNAYDTPMDPEVHPRTVTAEEIDGEETPVNRCTGIANLGGAAHDNEECYLLIKLLRALGLVYIEHQARI